jgi:hypothetical protein
MTTVSHDAMLLLLRRPLRNAVTLCAFEEFDELTTALTRRWEQKWVWGRGKNFHERSLARKLRFKY